MKMYGQWTDCDSLSVSDKNVRNYDFEWRQTILPASLIGVGAVALAPSFIRNGSRNVTRSAIGIRGDGRRLEFDDYIQYLPVAGSLMLGCAGIKARHSFRDRVFIVATSYAALAVLTNIPKLCIDEKRPEFSGHNSFPSGHTATVFMGAELVRIEYGGWYGAGAYAVAAGVGVHADVQRQTLAPRCRGGCGSRYTECADRRVELPVVAKSLSEKEEERI